MSESIEFAAHLLPLRSGASQKERVEHNRRMLLSVLNLKTTVAFIGSGVSRAFGYPSWDLFARGVIGFTENAVKARGSSEDFESLRPDADQELDSTDLMFLVGSCKRILGEDKSLLDEYHRYLESLFAPRKEPPKIDPFQFFSSCRSGVSRPRITIARSSGRSARNWTSLSRISASTRI